jgi:3-deoxy-D-manno-octulosonic-acid transferase
MGTHLIQKSLLLVYDYLWRLAIPFLGRNERLAEGLTQRTLHQKMPRADVWIQAASAGESYLAWSLLRKLRPALPLRVLLTANTSQGMGILDRAITDVTAENSELVVHNKYFPFDKPGIMATAACQIRPKVMVLLETEIWPGLILSLKEMACKIFLVNGRITQKSLKGYRKLPPVWPLLKPDQILAVTPKDAMGFERLFGQGNITLMPNMKFDRIRVDTAAVARENPLIDLIPAHRPLLVFGSVRQAEEVYVKEVINEIHRRIPNAIIGIFPRHQSRVTYWAEVLERYTDSWQKRSTLESDDAIQSIILWDTFGELAWAYQLASAAFVGGSLAPLGGQNFLEPLVYGVSPVIGPYWDNFTWVGREIIEAGLVREVRTWRQAAQQLARDLEHPSPKDRIMAQADHYIRQRQGGTRMVCRLIEKALAADDPIRKCA